MKRSSERFLTTHTGSLPRPEDLIRKLVFKQDRCQRRAAPDDQVRPVHRLDAANALNDVGSKTLGGPHAKLSGLWVATYFVAPFIASAIGLFGACGQKALQTS